MSSDICSCATWAGDLRVGRPNGHHPRCPQQPTPSRVVTLRVAPGLLAQGWLQLPSARIVGVRMEHSRVGDEGVLVFEVSAVGAPEGAVSMTPTYSGDGRPGHRLDSITWTLFDGATVRDVAVRANWLE